MNTELFCIERGEGFPLILLHGNEGSSEYFTSQIDRFSSSFHVIAVDTRGHGRSPRGTAPFTLSQFADDLKLFMDERGIGKAHILGFSDGANIALLFALRYPKMVDRLILNGADLSPGGVKLSIQIPIVLGYGLASLIALFDRKALAKKEMLGLMVTQPDIKPAELAALDMPVLVIAGTKDMIKEAHTRLIASSIPNATLRFIEGDHSVAEKNSKDFNAAVSAFLT